MKQWWGFMLCSYFMKTHSPHEVRSGPEGPKQVPQVQADSQTTSRPHNPKLQDNSKQHLMISCSHWYPILAWRYIHLLTCFLLHLSLHSLKPCTSCSHYSPLVSINSLKHSIYPKSHAIVLHLYLCTVESDRPRVLQIWQMTTNNRIVKVKYNTHVYSLCLNFTCFCDQRCVVVARQSSLIWEHGAVTAEHNDTTREYALSHTHTHAKTHRTQAAGNKRGAAVSCTHQFRLRETQAGW